MFVAIAGNIGSGKSSLTSLLHQKFGWTPHFESVDDNPYLPDFYADMTRWSFHLQVYFLSKRFILHRDISENDTSVVQDRSIYEDAEIFAMNLHNIGKMDDRDYENYRSLYAAMTSYLQPPDLLIYLRASIPTLQKQIRLRGRDFEQGIDISYLEQLNSLYENWISSYDLGRVLVIDSDETDFVHDMQKQEEILYLIDQAVRHKHR
ncbi:MAG: deoxynucleoside kinase [Ignavibacteria bacterium]|nr:MAG: deoxynucleoside kinase [Ignavibacteria bacterium]